MVINRVTIEARHNFVQPNKNIMQERPADILGTILNNPRGNHSLNELPKITAKNDYSPGKLVYFFSTVFAGYFLDDLQE